MKNFLYIILLSILFGSQANGQSNMHEALKEIPKAKQAVLNNFLARHGNNQLRPRQSSEFLFLNYPDMDSVTKVNINPQMVKKAYYWSFNYNLDTFSPMSSGLKGKVLMQWFNDFAYRSGNAIIPYVNDSIQVDVDSVYFGLWNVRTNNSVKDTLIIELYEDSIKWGVTPYMNLYGSPRGGALRGTYYTFIDSTNSDTISDGVWLYPKVSLTKGNGFYFVVKYKSTDTGNVMNITATYSEKCNDSAYGLVTAFGNTYYGGFFKPTSGMPNRLPFFNNTALSTPSECKYFYTQNYRIFPFLTVKTGFPTVTVVSDQTPTSQNFCPGKTTRLIANYYGFTDSAVTFSWTPTTGLDNPTSGSPTLTLGNTNQVYTVTVKSGTQSATGSVTTVSFGFNVNVTTTDSVLNNCNDIVKLSASASNLPTGNTITSYSWSNGSSKDTTSVSKAGTYTVSITSNLGCVVSSSKTVISSFSVPTLDFSFTPSTACPNEDVTFTVSSSAYKEGWKYTWKEGTTNIGTSNPLTTKFTSSGTKKIYLNADSNGCAATEVSKNFIVKTATACKPPSVSISNPNDINKITIYPNPVKNGEITIESAQSGKMQVRVIDILGKQIQASELKNSGSNKLDVSGLSNGVYFLELETKQGKQIEKIIIDK